MNQDAWEEWHDRHASERRNLSSGAQPTVLEMTVPALPVLDVNLCGF